VTNRMRVVTAAAKASQTSGSGTATNGPPGMVPDSEQGYTESCSTGTAMCWTAHSESYPAASADCANATACAGSADRAPLANMIPIWMPMGSCSSVRAPRGTARVRIRWSL
jgi:hypothetical protein